VTQVAFLFGGVPISKPFASDVSVTNRQKIILTAYLCLMPMDIGHLTIVGVLCEHLQAKERAECQ
jgi:hypothetical protein